MYKSNQIIKCYTLIVSQMDAKHFQKRCKLIPTRLATKGVHYASKHHRPGMWFELGHSISLAELIFKNSEFRHVQLAIDLEHDQPYFLHWRTEIYGWNPGRVLQHLCIFLSASKQRRRRSKKKTRANTTAVRILKSLNLLKSLLKMKNNPFCHSGRLAFSHCAKQKTSLQTFSLGFQQCGQHLCRLGFYVTKTCGTTVFGSGSWSICFGVRIGGTLFAQRAERT